METLIVFANDVEYAVQHLQPMHVPQNPTRWVLVACPPRLSRHSSRWISHRALADWHQHWAEDLLAGVQRVITAPGHEVNLRVADHEALDGLVPALRREFGPARLVDLRRAKFSVELAPIDGSTRPDDSGVRWQLPGAVAGMSAVLILAAE